MSATERETVAGKLLPGARAHEIAAKIGGDDEVTAYHMDMARTMREAADLLLRIRPPGEEAGGQDAAP